MNAKPDPADWVASWSRLLQEMYARVNPFISLAPQVLTQPILPGWLFANSINVTEENSASPGTEQAIVAKYSYGRQLGRIVDVLGELIDKWPGGAPDSSPVRQFAPALTTRRRPEVLFRHARMAAVAELPPPAYATPATTARARAVSSTKRTGHRPASIRKAWPLSGWSSRLSMV